MLEHDRTVHIFKRRVGRWKILADVTEGKAGQERVAKGVQQHVAIAVSRGAVRAVYRDIADDEGLTADKRVGVFAKTDTQS